MELLLGLPTDPVNCMPETCIPKASPTTVTGSYSACHPKDPVTG